MIQWTIDSGASFHMVNDLNLLTNISKFSDKIYFANDQFVESTHIGTFVGYINGYKIILNDVYYIPVFTRNLLSIDKLSKQKFKIVFYNYNDINYVSIYNPQFNRIGNFSSNNSGTYIIWTTLNNINFENNSTAKCFNLTRINEEDNLFIWHRRLGHFNIDHLKQELIKFKIYESCPICSNAKLRNKPFYPSQNKANYPFEKIHMDTVQSSDISIYGNKYFLSILDEFTRYGWVFFFKTKSEVFSIFQKWFNQVCNIFNAHIKYIKSDNGLEFINNNFKNFCSQHGIIHTTSIKYTPSQNGKAERFQETLIYNATALLKDAKLHHQFWEDAVATTNYIHNRIPHKFNNKTPYELLYNKKVDFNHFKVFGCKCYFFIPKQFRTKFKGSSLPGIFLGYDEFNHTAYKIYDVTNYKIIYSRCVDFYEDCPGNINAPSTVPEFFNFYPNDEIGGNINFPFIIEKDTHNNFSNDINQSSNEINFNNENNINDINQNLNNTNNKLINTNNFNPNFSQYPNYLNNNYLIPPLYNPIYNYIYQNEIYKNLLNNNLNYFQNNLNNNLNNNNFNLN